MLRNLCTLFLGTLILTAILSSCAKEIPETQEEQIIINLVELSTEQVPSSFTPTAIYEKDGNVLIYYANPGVEDYETFAYQDAHGKSLTILFGENRIVFSDGIVSSSGVMNLAIMEADEGFILLYMAEQNISTQEINIVERIPLIATGALSKSADIGRKDGDDIRFLFKEKLLDRIGDEMATSPFFLTLDAVTLGRYHVTDFVSLIGYLISMTGNTMLLDGAGSEFADATLETMVFRTAKSYVGKITDIVTGKAFKLKFNRMMTDFESTVAKYAPKLAEKGLDGVMPRLADISDSMADAFTNSVYNKSKKILPAMKADFFFDRGSPYQLTVDVIGVTTRHATFRGSCTYTGYNGQVGGGGPEMAVIEMGYCCENSIGEKTYSPSNNLQDVLSEELEPATKYWVYSYIRTMGGTFTSPYHRFITKGTGLIVSPRVIASLTEGGDFLINITVGEDVSWKIIECPSWCKALSAASGTSSGTFAFHINPTEGGRSGNIVVQAISSHNEEELATVAVKQTKELEWDGTSWVFTWPAGCEKGAYGDYDINIKSVGKGVYESYFETRWINAGRPAGSPGKTGPSQWCNIKYGDNGTVVLYYEERKTLPFPIGTGYFTTFTIFKHSILRTSETTATLNWTYESGVNDKVQNRENYILQGKKVN